MAVAVVKHVDLVSKATEVGFPIATKVPCESGLNGYVLWDKWIRENVFWVSELAFDPVQHVKITESAQLVGELPKQWELRCQKFVEGEAEASPFKEITHDSGSLYTHVNRQAIQVAVSNASYRYKLDFETEEDGSVVTHNRLAVAIFPNAGDTSLSYQSEIEVAQLWTTKVEHLDVADESGEVLTRPVLFKRAFANDPTIEESYPWIKVGDLTEAEYAEWVTHNVVEESTLEDGGSIDAREIDESYKSVIQTIPSVQNGPTEVITHAWKTDPDVFGVIPDTPQGITIGKTWEALKTTPADIGLGKISDAGRQEREFTTVVAKYPEADDSAIGGDVNS